MNEEQRHALIMWGLDLVQDVGTCRSSWPAICMGLESAMEYIRERA